MAGNHFIVSLIQSFGLHIFIGVGLVASVLLKADEKPKPVVIDVRPITSVAVDKDKLATQVNKIKTAKANKKRAEEKRVQDLENRASNAASKRRKEESKIKKLTKKTRQSQADKRKADAEAKRAKERQKRETVKANKAAADAAKKVKEKEVADKAAADANARRVKEEQAAAKAKADRIAKAKREKEEKRRKAKEARERREQELMLQQQMADEEAARNQAHSKKVLSEKEKYRALIILRIQQNIIRDESMKGKSCRLNIKMAFNGLVTSVKVLEGDPRVCQAAESGIYKAGKLPVSDDPAVFEEIKNITVTYEPEF